MSLSKRRLATPALSVPQFTYHQARLRERVLLTQAGVSETKLGAGHSVLKTMMWLRKEAPEQALRSPSASLVPADLLHQKNICVGVLLRPGRRTAQLLTSLISGTECPGGWAFRTFQMQVNILKTHRASGKA